MIVKEKIDFVDKHKIGSTLDYLKTVTKLRKKCEVPNDLLYVGIEDFVLQNGRQYENVKIVPKIKRGEPGHCFMNAYNLAFNNHRRFTYVEGFAISIIPIHHAWCVDKKGIVYDPTWYDDGVDYFGIPLDVIYVCQVNIRRKYYGSAIDNFEEHFPLLTGKHQLVKKANMFEIIESKGE